MLILPAAGQTRSKQFPTNLRENDTSPNVHVSPTNTLADARIDARFICGLDAARGYFSCTYHYLIRTNGVIEIGRDPNRITTRVRTGDAHKSILIGIVGGLTDTGRLEDTTTAAQEVALEELLQAIADGLNVEIEVNDRRRVYREVITEANAELDIEIEEATISTNEG